MHVNLDNFAGIHDVVGVEGLFNRLHKRNLCRGCIMGKFISFKGANTVLCADTAVHIDHKIVHDTIEIGITGHEVFAAHIDWLGQVVVNVAIANVTEGARADAGQGF